MNAGQSLLNCLVQSALVVCLIKKKELLKIKAHLRAEHKRENWFPIKAFCSLFMLYIYTNTTAAEVWFCCQLKLPHYYAYMYFENMQL